MSQFGHWLINYIKPGNRNDRYILKDMIEIDEGYFTIEASEHQHITQKEGRGSKINSNVMAMA